MRRRVLLLALAAPLLLAGSGCASAKKAYHRASKDLLDAATRYNEALRSGDVDTAATFIPTADRPAFFEAVTNVTRERRFTEVKVGPVDFPQGANEATVTVRRSFYRLDELTERHETFNQTWRWKKKELRWELEWTGSV